MRHKFLVHNRGDHVGVAVDAVEAGDAIHGIILEDDSQTEAITARSAIPLGHKVALADLPAGAAVIEYGVPIGVLTRDVVRGDYVHTHNLKTARWA